MPETIRSWTATSGSGQTRFGSSAVSSCNGIGNLLWFWGCLESSSPAFALAPRAASMVVAVRVVLISCNNCPAYHDDNKRPTKSSRVVIATCEQARPATPARAPSSVMSCKSKSSVIFTALMLIGAGGRLRRRWCFCWVAGAKAGRGM